MNNIKPKEVEEAMGRVGAITEDRIHSMLAHAATYGRDRESAQMRAEANALAEDLAVIKAALQPKVVRREWLEGEFDEIQDGYLTKEQFYQDFRNIGIEVEVKP